MTPVTLHRGDCLEVLKTLAGCSIDAIVTDPPYHLLQGGLNLRNMASKVGTPLGGKGFMGQSWDGGDIAQNPALWAEVLRVLKPGGHMVAFSGARTYHRMACAIEDAGFEIRDQIKFDHESGGEARAFLASLNDTQLAQFAKLCERDDTGQLAWVYGQGFPKSRDVSKDIDKAAGVEREVVGLYHRGMAMHPGNEGVDNWRENYTGEVNVTAPATAAARQWSGWGTALKPAWEPICLARKPLSEPTVAANVLRWGTGAINIDATRIEGVPPSVSQPQFNSPTGKIYGFKTGEGRNGEMSHATGRWPANLCHDGSQEVLDLFPESKGAQGSVNGDEPSSAFFGQLRGRPSQEARNDSGSAARFFYCAKASKADRAGSKHPTVKPVALMRWLCRMVTPPGGTVLDPFAGSGTTGQAALEEGFNAVLIEREEEYTADIERRLGLKAPSLIAAE